MNESVITRAKIEELLRFLPRFDQPGREFVKEWRGGPRPGAEAFHVPYPVYHEDVTAFFGLLARDGWSDYGYDPAQAVAMLEKHAFVGMASLEEVRTMLTYCLRAERFGDGAWEALLESGRIIALLHRLDALKDTVP